MTSVAASLFAPTAATSMTGQVPALVDMVAFGSLLGIAPVPVTSQAPSQTGMTAFGALPGADPAPVIPAPAPVLAPVPAPAPAPSAEAKLTPPPMATLLTIASVAKAEPLPAILVVQEEPEPVVAAPALPTECPAEPEAPTLETPLPPQAKPKDQPVPAAPPAAAPGKSHPEAPPIISTLQSPARPGVPVIAVKPIEKDAAKPEEPEGAPPPDESPIAIDTPPPLPQPAAIASPVPVTVPATVPVAAPVEKRSTDTRSAPAGPASVEPIRRQLIIPAPAEKIATDEPEHDAPVDQHETASTVIVDAAPRSAPGVAEPAPARDITPAFAAPPAPHSASLEAAAKAPIATITAQPGRIGQELGVAIAHHVATGTAATGGGETITLRLNPVDMGRIEVKLSFDDSGTLRAIVSADTPAALDMLRRDSADLGRALNDAGVRADTQTLRFDTRAGDGQRGQANDNGPPWQRQQDPRAATTADTGPDITEDITAYRPLRTRGGVDMVA